MVASLWSDVSSNLLDLTRLQNSGLHMQCMYALAMCRPGLLDRLLLIHVVMCRRIVMQGA